MDTGGNTDFLGELAALGTALCWVVTSIAFAQAGKRVGSFAVNYVRLFFAVPMLCVATFIAQGSLLPVGASAHSWLWLSVSGLIGFVLGDMFLFRAFILIGVRLSSLIMTTTPLMTALIGYFVLGETLGQGGLLGMLLTVAGVAWALSDRTADEVGPRTHRLSGVLLALGGAFGQGLGLVLSKHGMENLDAFTATQIRVIAAFAAWTLIIRVAGRWQSVGTTVRDPVSMRLLALGALFGPVVGVGLSLLAIQHTHAGIAASIMSTTPILLIPVSVVAFRERVGLGSVLGTFIAVGGVVVLFLV